MSMEFIVTYYCSTEKWLYDTIVNHKQCDIGVLLCSCKLIQIDHVLKYTYTIYSRPTGYWYIEVLDSGTCRLCSVYNETRE